MSEMKNQKENKKEGALAIPPGTFNTWSKPDAQRVSDGLTEFIDKSATAADWEDHLRSRGRYALPFQASEADRER